MGSVPPRAITGFHISDYRSFDSTGIRIAPIGKINLFIGQNNAGKSNVLRFLRQVSAWNGHGSVQFEALTDQHRRSGVWPELLAIVRPDQFGNAHAELDRLFSSAFGGVPVPIPIGQQNSAPRNPFKDLSEHQLWVLFNKLGESSYSSPPSKAQSLPGLTTKLVNAVARQFRTLVQGLVYIPPVRELRHEGELGGAATVADGRHVVSQLHEMQHPHPGNEPKRAVFDSIQSFVQDLLQKPELQLEVQHDKQQLLVRVDGLRQPLDSFGTGIHQLVILCSAVALHSEKIICIEEPEIHLHPDLQRRFLRFLKTTNNMYFITTHSNVLLDFDPDVNVFHVRWDGNRSTVDAAKLNSSIRALLDDLAYRASDLLQSNGVVWVEGPSDRIYLLKWLSLIASDVIEGIHFSVMFYGGSNLAHLTAASEPDSSLGAHEPLVDLLRVNRNAIVLIDKDGPSNRLQATKGRIEQELGATDACWISAGKEIENYLTSRVLAAVFSKRCNRRLGPELFQFHPESVLKDAVVEALQSQEGIRPSKIAEDKVEFARAATAEMIDSDLDVLDLRERVVRLANRIRGWSGMAAAN